MLARSAPGRRRALLRFAFSLTGRARKGRFRLIAFFLIITGMKVSVNNKTVETAAETLSQLIDELGLPADGMAVGVDGRIVPRVAWAGFALAEGQRLVVVRAACGG